MCAREVLFDDPDNRPEDGPHMEFRLTYQGPLLSIQGDPIGGQSLKQNQRKNKYDMRRKFHFQLRRLWETTPFLDSGDAGGPSGLLLEQAPSPRRYDRTTLATRHSMYGFRFVPLVTKDLKLLCGLDVLFLRPDRPGDAVWRGDIDNRLKMLIDALKLPEANEDYSARTPLADEDPVYCLLEDDRLVTKIAVETDQLLDIDPNDRDSVKLVITVRVRASEPASDTVQFI